MMLNFFIERPIFSAVISIIIVIAGAIAMFGLPISQYPQIVPPQVQVSASLAGANAAVVAESIAAPLEQQVNGAKKMIYMDSKSSNDGAYNLTITFEVGTDQDLAAVDVQNRVAVAQSQLPADVIRQGVTVRKQSSSILAVLALRSKDNRYDNIFLSNYMTLNVLDAVARVPGVGSAKIFGGRDYSMRIWLNPEKMARLGVTAGDISKAVNEQNVVAPAGRVGVPPAPAGTQMQYSVTVQGRLADVGQYEDIILSAGTNGRIVRLRDVARVELAAADYSVTSRESGETAAFMGIYLQPDANALDTAKAVRKAMDALAVGFPEGLFYTTPFSTTPFVTESIKEVAITLFEAFLLVVIVVFVFLQSWRATLIPVLVVPVSLIGTFAAFTVLGFSINTLTLFALVLAIGIVVDDAIVVVEAVQEKLDSKGLSPLAATKEAMSEVGGPVIAIGLVLCAVFIPVAFLGGLTGQLYKQFALTLTVSVLLSVICALTLTPALCALMLRPKAKGTQRQFGAAFFGAFNRLFAQFTARYSSAVQTMIRRAMLVSITFVVMLIALYALVTTRPTGLVPNEDQGYVIAVVSLPVGASAERTLASSLQFEKIALSLPGVDGTAAINGFNLLTGLGTSYNASVFVRLKPWDERKSQEESAEAILGALMGRANSEIHDGTFLVVNPPPIQGLGSSGGFEFVLQDRSGSSPQRFAEVLNDFMATVRKRPEIGFAFTSVDFRVPQIQYDIDREKAKSLGVSLSDIFLALQTFLGGNYINDFNLYGRTYRVVAQAEPALRAMPEDVNRFHVRSASGEMVPLSTLISIKSINGPEYFQRYNIYGAATINGSANRGFSSGQAAAAMEDAARSLPEGFSYEWTGSTYQEKKTGGQTVYVFVLSLIFVFLVLAALYESWAMPAAILLVIPFGVFGAFSGLLIRSLDNNIYTQIGLVMLIGLAAKNAILIVEFARLAHDRGASIVDGALQAARQRLRPILMTSFAFILGSVPLVIASGAGASSRQSLGTAVVFGMLFATVVGIFFIPVFYAVIQRIAEKRHPFKDTTSPVPSTSSPNENAANSAPILPITASSQERP
jgi:hydrophobe/amphiphile efflux-1 (HAE1) family protein